MPDLPKISVIMPSLNQVGFIEQAIQSVLGQNYPSLEFLVMDGGSTDGTLEVLKKYEGALCWISEPDNGQVDAINKGLRKATGDVVAYLNSDDLYLPGAFITVGCYFAQHQSAGWATGWCTNFNQFNRVIRPRTRLYKNILLAFHSNTLLRILNYISQPSTFWRRSAMEAVGYLNEGLEYAMDYDYWLRLSQRYRLHVIPRDLAVFRIHLGSKSSAAVHLQFDEELAVARGSCSKGAYLVHRIYHACIVQVYRYYMSKDNGR